MAMAACKQSSVIPLAFFQFTMMMVTNKIKYTPPLTTIILFTKIVSNVSRITGQEANQNHAVASSFFSMLTKRNRIHTLLATIILFKESVYNPIRRLPHPRLRCEPNNAPASSFFLLHSVASSFTLSPAPPTLHSTSDISGASWLIVLIAIHPDYNH
jgi:hypothetical protein